MAQQAVIPVFEVKADQVAAFLARVATHRDNCLRLEPGCVTFEILVDDDQPGRVMLYEIYADEAALAAHRASEHLQAFRADIAPMIESRDLRNWRIVA